MKSQSAANKGGQEPFSPKFDAQGLVTAVAVESSTGEILMVAHMNREALEATRNNRKATFFSRSRNKLWVKGETSGNFLEVEEIRVDCDQDCVLLRVRLPAGCRLPYRSQKLLLPPVEPRRGRDPGTPSRLGAFLSCGRDHLRKDFFFPGKGAGRAGRFHHDHLTFGFQKGTQQEGVGNFLFRAPGKSSFEGPADFHQGDGTGF